MPEFKDLKGIEPAWCPGCGNFGILKAFKDTLVQMNIEPHEFTAVSGIGQAAKFPHYIKCNTFNGLHGRALPAATGIRLANHKQRVMIFTGDGDCYGEGGNHLIHTIRRNINMSLFVHDNQIYGLTKGQASPTSAEGIHTKNQPLGVFSEQLNPMAMAIALDCSFVARSFSADPEHLTKTMKAAIEHNGFSLVDILQPCITFNKLNTYEWYKERVYYLENEYNPEDRVSAFARSLEWGDKIPLGIIYKNNRPALEDRNPVISELALVKQQFNGTLINKTLREFY
ncbi:MAG: 2-oxoacid:ferredoxin oxidoreductase subunit beta [Nitrospira sp.]|nr:2-oxoacid:ferredoxin oxidoreductase subunit beta [bacterium]MBL7048113.1 2-oxoacid:ferredoxin oxidoreductase subunit beta [Nitrospira sp.]